MVIIPIGATPSKTTSEKPIEVARNYFVTSSPKRVRRGARFVKALLAKLLGSMVAFALLVAILKARNKFPKSKCFESISSYSVQSRNVRGKGKRRSS